MEKIILQNRKNQKIVGVLEKPIEEIKGICIVQHGYSGFKEQDHIQVMKDVFLENGFIVFNFDTTNSFNESDGEFIDSTLGLHYEDLEDVVKWVQKQGWFQKPLAITGHSMGGYAVARYAEKYSDEVDLLVPVAPVVSGELSFEAHERFEPGALEQWKQEGIKETTSSSRLGVVKRMTWESMAERLNHNLLSNADKITMPTLLIVGSKDQSCPPDHIKQLFDAIPEGCKDFELIEGAPHTYRSKEDLEAIKVAVDNWLKNHL
ncbi:MAG: alpha/beta hydrolase family protein [Patescibacteria group bacterium]